MRTVALETTHTTGTIALLNDRQVVTDLSLPPDRRSAQTLLSSLRSALDQSGWTAQQIDLVAVACGPGSFTGLRVGVTAAKTLAYAVQAALVGVNTLRAMAAAAPPKFQTVWPAIDAQRQRVFTARFARRDDQLTEIQPTVVWSFDEWLAQLEPGDAVSGSILDRLEKRIPGAVSVVDRSLWLPRAAWVGRLAIGDFTAGHREDIWQFAPHYYQKSAAEEKLNPRPPADP
ncbi:MAG: tRNA (adenosine(37)-N6)-threonylcarbamoyltransferase complex dimerization subunit type 1 TsaB [Planctomycetales bacterium]|nr:tRNA (adenosine(37)-N6)-threonylcarbamoyltransferase complex dimerization subunit type 1 TsaB [Planctomycetales bacterium]NIM10273.1 tRNA (adenosine(37)-N6)-threonylcarbamoyltransferase complex dimerization subunit type 1 TsaB [Planctomycetales bacterium]NIN09711.1 tRNA (adenosine(37)-N6)-threonylcarbamoyltransferase complex dimerization subunit type 1 TsaB [Planctomycetales bacterium]NIN78831.1 tRNA (adenosine(37)-N6)-threonylcarbamoyltransferase complex dimerization subunit type 1 TsaB [Pla